MQRTKLNVSVSCQAWHAKNARHMLLGEHEFCNVRYVRSLIFVLDIVDYNEPTMLIVGSRGLGQLKGYVVVVLPS